MVFSDRAELDSRFPYNTEINKLKFTLEHNMRHYIMILARGWFHFYLSFSYKKVTLICFWTFENKAYKVCS
jgi:hypothetical protein